MVTLPVILPREWSWVLPPATAFCGKIRANGVLALLVKKNAYSRIATNSNGAQSFDMTME